ncbi:MAG: triose-phosphate isomerase [Candidatus Eremiobacteraeota bacterium]|nr:triose-phosphate isomerase [Candidatus Eremiobacteraeota bacterium]
MARRPLVAGNWKMHKTSAEAVAFAMDLLRRALPPNVDVAVCAPFTALAALGSHLAHTSIALGAQDLFWEPQGAYTGEISGPMLLDLGVRYVIVGHSERRQYFGEIDATVGLKTAAALACGLTPIVAVGESLEQRDAGDAHAIVATQTRGAIGALSRADAARVVMAYEPVWAIGTGRHCDPVQASETIAAIRASVDGLDDVRILYGGSVKPDNVARYVAQDGIDGALVGRASLDAAAFAALIGGCA